MDIIEPISEWGVIAEYLYLFHENKYWSYLLSIIGIIIFLLSLNIVHRLRFPKFNFNKRGFISKPEINNKFQKKEPIIKNIPINSDMDMDQNRTSDNDIKISENYLSPSLDILENKNDIQNKSSEKLIGENSNLLENVFADFNIEVKVINVRLGPVITLYEILPAAGIKLAQ